MFDFAWSELALIAVVALVFIPPKDLPRAMRTVGTWVRKARAIAHEFQGNLEQMVRDAELDEVRREVEKATQFNINETIANTVDPGGELHGAFDEHSLTGGSPAPLPPPESTAAPAAGTNEPAPDAAASPAPKPPSTA
jgi:sec-independent protein translocase protein TatB